MAIRFSAWAIVLMLLVPGAAGAQAPSGDSVTGQATDCLLLACEPEGMHLRFDVRSGPAGENPTGTVSFREFIIENQDQAADLEVTCLRVNGNVAIIGGSGRGSSSRYDLAYAGLIRVVDGGSAVGHDTIQLAIIGEMIDQDTTSLPGPTDCSSFPSSFAPPPPYVPHPYVNDIGDVVVSDARRSPASKADCQQGRWRDYGDTFKNQGQCVAFVKRGPKP